jgi:hypothetical protein
MQIFLGRRWTTNACKSAISVTRHNCNTGNENGPHKGTAFNIVQVTEILASRNKFEHEHNGVCK